MNKKYSLISANIFLCLFALNFLSSCNKNSELKIIKHPVTLRLSDNHGKGYPTTMADEEFGRLVEQETNGRIKIEVRAGGALASNEGDAIEALKYGDLAFTRVSASSVSAYVDQINAIQFPYLYK
ncbi:MAG: TRAP transporter substrate-binding protein, partial [Treponema sp.]|nr:TRAP transporter substrate-binding protein [Treponema sp.]